jgi:hypothetical protein
VKWQSVKEDWHSEDPRIWRAVTDDNKPVCLLHSYKSGGWTTQAWHDTRFPIGWQRLPDHLSFEEAKQMAIVIARLEGAWK